MRGLKRLQNLNRRVDADDPMLSLIVKHMEFGIEILELFSWRDNKRPAIGNISKVK